MDGTSSVAADLGCTVAEKVDGEIHADAGKTPAQCLQRGMQKLVRRHSGRSRWEGVSKSKFLEDMNQKYTTIICWRDFITY